MRAACVGTSLGHSHPKEWLSLNKNDRRGFLFSHLRNAFFPDRWCLGFLFSSACYSDWLRHCRSNTDLNLKRTSREGLWWNPCLARNVFLEEEGDSSWNTNFHLTFILPIPPAMYLRTDEYPLCKWKLGGFTSSINLKHQTKWKYIQWVSKTSIKMKFSEHSPSWAIFPMLKFVFYVYVI